MKHIKKIYLVSATVLFLATLPSLISLWYVGKIFTPDSVPTLPIPYLCGYITLLIPAILQFLIIYFFYRSMTLPKGLDWSAKVTLSVVFIYVLYISFGFLTHYGAICTG